MSQFDVLQRILENLSMQERTSIHKLTLMIKPVYNFLVFRDVYMLG